MQILSLPYELIACCILYNYSIRAMINLSMMCKYTRYSILRDQYYRNKLSHAKLQAGINKSICTIICYDKVDNYPISRFMNQTRYLCVPYANYYKLVRYNLSVDAIGGNILLFVDNFTTRASRT